MVKADGQVNARNGSVQGQDTVVSIPDFTLRVLAEGQSLGGVAQYHIDSETEQDGLRKLSIKTEAVNLRACLLELRYDPAAYIPESGLHGDWPGVGSDLLRLAVLDHPGTVYYGASLAQPGKQKGVSGDFEVLELEFRPITGNEFIPAAAGSPSPLMAGVGAVTGDFDGDGVVALPDILALAQQPAKDALAGLDSMQGNFLHTRQPGTGDMVRAGQQQIDSSGVTGEPSAFSIPDVENAVEFDNTPQTSAPQLTPMRAPQFSAPGSPAANLWPSDKRMQGWLSSVYLGQPRIDSAYGVYGNTQQQQYAQSVFELTNDQRAKKGQKLLRREPHLDAIAQAQAMHLAKGNYFEHETPDGLTPFDRIDAADPPKWWAAGENIAGGQPNPDNVVKTWMGSKGHKLNIRNENYEYIGLGAYYDPDSEYGWYWVQVFASFDQDPADHDWIEPGECPQ